LANHGRIEPKPEDCRKERKERNEVETRQNQIFALFAFLAANQRRRKDFVLSRAGLCFNPSAA
jgi:hypothetical protein